MQDQNRQYSLDILRGFFIFLALWQHYCYFYNVWFIDYFRDQKTFETIYGIYEHMLGKYLACDDPSAWATYYLTPWVSQIYLFLAAFNLGRKDQSEFKSTYKKKMTLFGLFFLFFTAENFVVAPNFGAAISFYPIQAWMVILALISTLYYLFSTKAIIVLAVLSLVRFIIPDADLGIEEFIQLNFHVDYEFDAHPAYFLTTGALGFLLSRAYFSFKNQNKTLLITGGIGLTLCVLYYFVGIPSAVDRTNMFAYEHLLISDFVGSLYLWGIQLLIVAVFLLLENKKYLPNIKVLSYMGAYSIAIFAFHKLFFIYLWMPIRLFIGALFSFPPENNIAEIWPTIILCVLTVHIIRKTKILQLVFK